jgi:hypothetical protein
MGFRTSVRDITERQQLRDELRRRADSLEQLVEQRTARLRRVEQQSRQMERLAALGRLAAAVAHEINNPLAGMRNAFELIKEDLTPEHRHFELLELIDREIERVSGIVHQMYQLYGRAPQTPSDFDLVATVRGVLKLLARSAERQGVVLRCTSRWNHLPVRLPEGEVKQILYNLVLNAVQASPSGQSVRVCVKPNTQGDELTVAVVDRGSGIADSVLPFIFDPFFSTKSTDVHAGMGLGLSVSKSLIESMGGRIQVRSRVGWGSTFFAVFPQRVETSGG